MASSVVEMSPFLKWPLAIVVVVLVYVAVRALLRLPRRAVRRGAASRG